MNGLWNRPISAHPPSHTVSHPVSRPSPTRPTWPATPPPDPIRPANPPSPGPPPHPARHPIPPGPTRSLHLAAVVPCRALCRLLSPGWQGDAVPSPRAPAHGCVRLRVFLYIPPLFLYAPLSFSTPPPFFLYAPPSFSTPLPFFSITPPSFSTPVFLNQHSPHYHSNTHTDTDLACWRRLRSRRSATGILCPFPLRNNKYYGINLQVTMRMENLDFPCALLLAGTSLRSSSCTFVRLSGSASAFYPSACCPHLDGRPRVRRF